MPDAKKRIALIDDDPSIDRTIGRILEKNGYEVHVSTDSKTAIECLKQKSYDAIIIDYDLGSGDTGLDIIRKLAGANEKTPKFLLTGYPTHEVVKASKRYFNKIWFKPISPTVLLEELKKIDCIHNELDHRYF